MSKIDLDKMWEGMREGLERDEAAGRLAGLTVKALAEAISHPKAPAMIAEIMAAETSSVAVGEPARTSRCRGCRAPAVAGAPSSRSPGISGSGRWRSSSAAIPDRPSGPRLGP